MAGDLGEASGRVRIEYESAGAQQVYQELERMQHAAAQMPQGFNQASTAMRNMGQVGGEVTGALGQGVQQLTATFLTLGRSGSAGMGAIVSAMGMLQKAAGQAMAGVKNAVSSGVQGLSGVAAGGGSAAGSALGMAFKSAGVAAIVTAVAAVGTVLGAGLKRLVALDEARFKLKALGYDAEQVKGVMEDVREAVLNTAYSLDEAATAAGQALAAGVKPGEELTRYLKNVASLAAVTGREFGEMAHTMNQITAQGKLMGIQLRQLEMSGLAPVEMLSKQLGKSQSEIRDMVSKGQITAKIWQETVTNQMGDAADIMGKSIMGSIRNLKAAVGRLGESFLKPLFSKEDQDAIAPIPALINKVSEAVDKLGKIVKAWMEGGGGQGFITTLKDIGSIAVKVAGWIVRAWGQQIKLVFDVLSTIWKAAAAAVKVFIDAIKPIFEKYAPAVDSALDQTGSKAKQFGDWFKTLAPIIAEAMAHIAAIAVDGFSRMVKALQIFAEFLGHTAPIWIDFCKTIVEGMQWVGKAAGFVGNILEKVPGPARFFGKELKGIESATVGAKKGLDGLDKGIKSFHAAAPAMGELSREMTGVSKTLRDYDFKAGFAAAKTKGLTEEQKRNKAAAEAVGEAQFDLIKILEELGLSMEELQEGVQGSEKDYAKLLKTLEKKGAPPELVKYIKDARKEFEAAGKSGKTLADAIKTIGDQSATAETKAKALINSLREMGYLPGEIEDAENKFREFIRNITDWQQEAVDPLWQIGPALVDANGELVKGNQNASKLHKTLQDAQAQAYEYAIQTGNAEKAWEETADAMRVVLRRYGIMGPVADQLISKYLGPKNVMEFGITETGGDETNQKFKELFMQIDNEKRKGNDTFNLDFRLGKDADADAFKQMAEQFGLIWQDYNEVNGIVKLQIPSATEFVKAQGQIQQQLATPPVKIQPEIEGMPPGFKPWWTKEEMEAAKAKPPEAAPTPVAPEAKPVEKPSEVAQEEKDAIKAFTEEVPNLFKPAVDKAKEQGRKFAESFAEGILSAVSSVQNAATTIAASAAGALPSSPAKYGPLSGQGAPSRRGEKFTSAFAQGISANVGSVRQAAVSVAYGAGKPMTDRFEQMLADVSELASFGKKAFDLLNSVVNIGISVGKLFESFMPQRKEYEARTQAMTAEQYERYAEQRRLMGQPVAPYTPGAQGKPGTIPIGGAAGGAPYTGGMPPPPSPSASKKENAAYIYYRARAAGYNDMDSKSIVAYAVGESGLNPTISGQANDPYGQAVAGFFQMTPDFARRGRVSAEARLTAEGNVTAYLNQLSDTLAKNPGMPLAAFGLGVGALATTSVGGPLTREGKQDWDRLMRETNDLLKDVNTSTTTFGDSVSSVGAAVDSTTSSVRGLGSAAGGAATSLGAIPPGRAIKGEEYGLPVGTGGAGGYGVGGQKLFPAWVKQIEQAFGLVASTYAGHQESAGFGKPGGVNRGIDWVPVGETGGALSREGAQKLQRFAEFLQANAEVAEQVIWQNPYTGERVGVYGGAPTKGVYGEGGQGWPGHQDHVHTRQSNAILIDALGANTSATQGNTRGLSGFGVPGAAPAPAAPIPAAEFKPRPGALPGPPRLPGPLPTPGPGIQPLPTNADGSINVQLSQQDSDAIQRTDLTLHAGIPDLVRAQADQDDLLRRGLDVAQSGQVVDASEAVPLLNHLDGLIDSANKGDTPQAKAQAQYLGDMRDKIMVGAGIQEAAGGGPGMLDQIGSIAGGVSTIINDFFDLFETTLKAIADTKAATGILARGIANTEDVMRIIDTFQTFLELGAKVAQTVSDIAGFAAQMVGAGGGADPSGGAAAAATALQAVSAIAGIIAGVIQTINTSIELAQEAYKIGTKYMGRMLQAWFGLPGANDIRYLLDTLTGQLKVYTTENPELKQTFNTLGRALGATYGDRIGAQNLFNIYQGPGQDPRDTMSDAMFAVRSSGVGAFGYAGQ